MIRWGDFIASRYPSARINAVASRAFFVNLGGIIHIAIDGGRCLCGERWQCGRRNTDRPQKKPNVIWRDLAAITCENCKTQHEEELVVVRKREIVVKGFEIMRKVALKDHPDVEGVRKCYNCHGEMVPATGDEEFCLDGEKILVCGIKFHKCVECGEGCYSSEEAKRIEVALQPYMPKRAEC